MRKISIHGIKCKRKARNSSCLIQSVERSNKSFRQLDALKANFPYSEEVNKNPP